MAIVNKIALRIAAMFVSMAVIGGMQLASVSPAAALDGLVRTDKVSGSRSMESPKSADAGCPAGKIVVGGGAEIEGGGENEANQPRLTLLFPLVSFFRAAAEIRGHAPAQELWTLRVYAICADAKDLDDYGIIVSPGSGHDSQPFKKSVARCPDGTVAYGAGGFIHYLHSGESQGGVGLQLVHTSGPLDIARATARKYPGGHPGAWEVAAVAICAAPAGGIRAENTGGEGEKATHRCSSGRAVHGAGGGGGLDDGGPVHLRHIISNEELTHVFVRLTGKLKPAIGGMVASATCAE
jgi:hypothetical protein